MKHFAVIVAGGKGVRMNSELPKQFMLLLDAPVLMHTIEKFANTDPDIKLIVVLPEPQIQTWSKLCLQLDFDIQHEIVVGGDSRFESVRNGLAHCPDVGVVAIHDGVRPLVSPTLVTSALKCAEEKGSAVPVVPISQSLRKIETDGTSSAVDRNGIYAVQTPQCFDLAKIKPGYDLPPSDRFTDDTTVFEHLGYQVELIDGESTNIKITTPADLKIAEAILSMSEV